MFPPDIVLGKVRKFWIFGLIFQQLYKLQALLKNMKTIKNKRAMTDPLQLITGIVVIVGGLLYLLNKGNLGLVVVSIGLLIEAMKKIIG